MSGALAPPPSPALQRRLPRTRSGSVYSASKCLFLHSFLQLSGYFWASFWCMARNRQLFFKIAVIHCSAIHKTLDALAKVTEAGAGLLTACSRLMIDNPSNALIGSFLGRESIWVSRRKQSNLTDFHVSLSGNSDYFLALRRSC